MSKSTSNPIQKLSSAVAKTGGKKNLLTNHAYVQDAIKKLGCHPDYCCALLREKEASARKLVDVESVKTYFNDQPPTTTAENPPNASPPAKEASSEDHSTFSVKLYLTLDCGRPTALYELTEDEEIKEIDCLQASLLVGEVLVEWTPYNLVIPHRNVPEDPVLVIDLSHTLSEWIQSKPDFAGQDHPAGVNHFCREVFLGSLAQIIVTYNRHNIYRLRGQNSQNFVQCVLREVGIACLPVLSMATGEYITNLRSGQEALPALGNHMELDKYVMKNMKDFDNVSSDPAKLGKVEYLVTLYYQFHMESRTGPVGVRCQEWRCSETHCQMNRLCQIILQ